MDYGDLLNIIRERRTVRKYRPDKQVTLEQVMDILEAARWAPSGANVQPWEFVIVREKGKLKKVAQVFLDQEQRIRQTAPHFPHPKQDYHLDISTYVFVCSDDRFKSIFIRGEAGADFIYHLSLGACIQNILLAATSLGLVSAWLTPTLDPQAHQELQEVVDLPDYIRIVSLVPLGYAGGGRKSGFRRPIESMIHQNRFDESKLRDKEEADPVNYFKKVAQDLKAQGEELP